MKRPFFPKRRSKFNVDMSAAGKLARTVDGIVFHSKREAARYRVLKAWENAGVISGLRRQVRFTFELRGVVICAYVLDFLYQLRDGSLIHEDVKGARTGEYAIKRRLMKAIYEIDVMES